VTLRNIHLQGIGLRRPESIWNPALAIGLNFSDQGCRWDANGGTGPYLHSCYIDHITVDGGDIKQVAGEAISSGTLTPDGPARHLTLRNLIIEDAGIKLGGSDSQGVSLFGGTSVGTDSGLLLENNEFRGGDADGNGVPDLTQLVRLDSAHNAVFRNNLITGRTSGGPSALINLTNINSVEVSGNTFVVEQPAGKAILLGNGALNNIILNNLITIPQTGVSITDYNSGGTNQYIGNSITIIQ
jgi:hypothetical protein